MASTLTTRVVQDGVRQYIIDVIIDGDTSSEIATGTTGNPIVDLSGLVSLNRSVGSVALKSVKGSVGAFEVKLLWDATADDVMLALSEGPVDLCFEDNGYLQNPDSDGSTGDVLIVTEGLTAGENATLRLEFRKRDLG